MLNYLDSRIYRNIFYICLSVILFLEVPAFAELRKPKIYPQNEQIKEQEVKDIEECRAMAIKATGIDPDILEIKMRAAESMQGRASMPGPRGGLAQSSSRLSRMDDYGSKVKEIEREYDT